MKKNRVISLILAIILGIGVFLPLTAQGVGESETPIALPQQVAQNTTEIVSNALYLVDSTTGTVLQEKNIHVKTSPAGLTKMITALTVLENANITDTVVVSDYAATVFKRDGGLVDLKTGEELSVLDLLYCLILAPSNEAAIALAEHTANGSVDEFVVKMNALAAKIGTTETNFANPTGVDDANQYTTAYDMYLIGKYAQDNPRYMEISNTVQKNIPPTNATDKERFFATDNYLIYVYKIALYYYKYARGMASGYTTNGGYCLVTNGKKANSEMNLICVVLGGKKHGEENLISSYTDAKTAMEDTFARYEIKNIALAEQALEETGVIAAKKKDYVTVGTQTDVKLVLPKDVLDSDIKREITLQETVIAPVKKGDVLGTVTISFGEKEYGKYPLTALYTVDRSLMGIVFYTIGEFFKNTLVRLLMVAFAVFLGFYVYLTIQTNKRRQELLKKNKLKKSKKRY